MSYGRRIKSWDGHTEVNDETTYSAVMEVASDGTLSSQVTETPRPGNTAMHVRVDPGPLDFDLLIAIEGGLTQAKYDQLKQWFNPKRGQRYLVATDEYGDGDDERILCVVRGPVEAQNTTFFVAHMHAVDGVWQAVDEEDDDETLGEGGGETLTWSQTNDGTDDTPFVFTVTPGSAKSSADSYTKRRWLSVANRSEDEVDDTESDGLPVMVADLTELSITPGDDVRLFNGALELRRWIDASDRVWANLHLRPRKVATLAANINASVTALSVNNAEGFDKDNFYDSGFFKIDNETIQYSGRGKLDAGLLTRGARGSTAAAHTAGATVYWVEHDYLYLLYDKDTPGSPPDGDDYEPLQDLDTSSNTERVWTDEFYNEPGGHRSGGFQRRATEAGAGSEHVRQYATGGVATFENDLPEAGKPALNDAVIPLPIPGVGPIVLDANVGLTMLLRGFVSDREQYESRLINEPFTSTPLTAESFALPSNVGRLRLNGGIGVVVGLIDQVTTAAISAPGTVAEQYLNNAVRFQLTQQTKVTKIGVLAAKLAGAAGDLRVYLMEDGGGEPGIDEVPTDTDNDGVADATRLRPNILAGALITNADLPTVAGGPLDWIILDFGAVQLEAGTYWLSFMRLTTDTGSLLLAQGSGPFVSYINGSLAEQDDQLCFFIFSDETEPQNDGPLDNGDTIALANLHIPLDSTRSPKVDAGAEAAVYVLDETLENGTNGEYLQLFFPLTVDEGLEVDTGRRLITDLETGLLVPWARQASSARWPHLAPGANALNWIGDGVTDLAYEATWKPLRL